jgi:hypothetical protein
MVAVKDLENPVLTARLLTKWSQHWSLSLTSSIYSDQ